MWVDEREDMELSRCTEVRGGLLAGEWCGGTVFNCRRDGRSLVVKS